MATRITKNYFQQHDAVFIARDILGKTLVRQFENGEILRAKITETEAYLGTDDLACHASKGRTPRTEIMFGDGGYVYVYLIYGIHWLLNIITGTQKQPEAILIRGIDHCTGPGRIGKLLKLDKTFYGEDLETSNRIWIEESSDDRPVLVTPRVGIDYAGDYWKSRPWRFLLDNKSHVK